jgi:hypothetical protein
MPFHKTLHGLPPADLFVQTHHAMATMERLVYEEFFLLILVAALPRRETNKGLLVFFSKKLQVNRGAVSRR